MGKMEVEEIEGVIEKIWELHDKLSDAILSISRSHFLNSLSLNHHHHQQNPKTNNPNPNPTGVEEAKSLHSIRSALESLEDQLEFLHTVEVQQRAERDAAIARLEQSRIILAMRLADHHGTTKYKVIDEALAFVGDVHDATIRFVSFHSCGNAAPVGHEGVASNVNVFAKFLVSSFEFLKKPLSLEHVGALLGNATLFAVSMIAMLHLHQITHKQEDVVYSTRNVPKASPPGEPFESSLNRLDVTLARG